MSSRRHLLFAAGGALLVSPALVLAERLLTPRQTLGPFYPDQLPLDRDNDLVRVEGRAEEARGIHVQLQGSILDAGGRPLAGALVEIWQVDANGIYLHSRGGDRQRLDPGFQGYGRFVTAADGRYGFRTIRPVSYPGRTPHIHLAVTLPGMPRFATQCYVRGEPGNQRDGLLNAIRDPRLRELLIVPFVPVSGQINQQIARFDVVLGVTPAS
ncbi:protocatechuate 3,4-dioxygenase [Ectopseudomonas guguanensis]|uniref:protocatechuate 3,4-dioxygenase n=1 Tax=Ectopseudomonas guguanensis TaxID=1198456 RepID=UPI0012D659BA|nr:MULTISPECIES: protocatechuate 3,4-dioxygenase [Pseudomonas]MPT16453.1 intradiol ring-cleavage dioxygenase [Pseudomonas sp.]WJH55062.1 intradiol ring-cleavage dioxygenase [Pseudomonas guguanensis]